MLSIVKAIVGKFIRIAHHIACGFTGALAFGFAAYLLDLGGFRSAALTTKSIDMDLLIAIVGVGVTFVGVNIVMKQFMGKDGAF